MKTKIIGLGLVLIVLLAGCDSGKEDVIRDIKIDMSEEYQVPMSDIDVETVDYGVTKFTTNQFKATIKSKGLSFYVIDKNNSNNYRRIPINK